MADAPAPIEPAALVAKMTGAAEAITAKAVVVASAHGFVVPSMGGVVVPNTICGEVARILDATVGSGTAINSTNFTYDTYNLREWTTTAMTTNDIWYEWVNDGTATNHYTLQEAQRRTMRLWTYATARNVADAGLAPEAAYRYIGGEEPVLRTPEQEAALRAIAAQRAENEARLRVEHHAVEGRALATMRSLLSKSQREQWDKERRFFVTTPDGRTFLIRAGSHGNVYSVDRASGKLLESFCAAPTGVPWPDAVLGQKLLLENDPEAYLARANRSAAYPHPEDHADAILRALAEAA